MNQPKNSAKPLVIAQFSDSHLFANINDLHYGTNVYQNLQQVLADIAEQKHIDIIIFTGDLSQDHSEQSYKNFASAVKHVKLKVPVFFLAGNHDEFTLLNKYLHTPEFCAEKIVNTSAWQVHLLNSKSETPAGLVSKEELSKLKETIDQDKFQLLMMHHHPVDVGYFIDRHGLTNQADFWKCIDEMLKAKIKISAIACGHVHRASFLPKHTLHSLQSVDIYTCPATSIAFDPSKDTVSSLGVGASYRLLYLFADGSINSEIVIPT